MIRGQMTKLVVLLVIAAIATAPAAAQEPDLPNVTIGIVVDGPWVGNEAALLLFQNEIHELLAGEYDVRFPQNRTLAADWTADSVKSLLDYLVGQDDVDLVIAMGVIASDIACSKQVLPKPVVAPFVIDILLQQVPFDGRSSGRTNLNYVALSFDVTQSVAEFRKLVPFERVVFLQPRQVLAAIPELRVDTTALRSDLGIIASEIMVDSTAQPVIEALPPDIEAVYLGALMIVPEEEFQLILEELNRRRLPSFALFGRLDVERGVLAGIGQGPELPLVSRRIALNIQRILLGEEASSLPVLLSQQRKLTLNMETARKIGVYPGWEVLTEAELLNEIRAETGRLVTFKGAIREALNVNLDLAAKKRDLAADRQDVNDAVSNLLPNIELSALGLIIDEDRAAASLGSQAERTVSGSAGVTQVIYSEPAWANVSIQKKLRSISEAELEQVRLDIVLDVATGYISLLSALTTESILKDNLNLTRSHLDLARSRQVIGVSGPGEVYRWESQLASNRQDVITMQANRNLAEIALNRLLSHPAEERFTAQEIDMSDFMTVLYGEQLMKYSDNKWTFRVFREYMVGWGLSLSPELKQLDAAVKLQQRIKKSATHAFWSPTVAVSGTVTNRFSREGAGTGSAAALLGPLLPPGVEMTSADDLDWNVGLSVSLPLFSGGAKFASYRKADEELHRLRLERNSLADKIEQNIRSALHAGGASYASIGFSHDAAEAANKNLELVTDAYSSGVVSILDLLDAQNAALVAEQVAANAVHAFLIDFMKVQRAVGKFIFLMSEEEVALWLDEIEAYFVKARENGTNE